MLIPGEREVSAGLPPPLNKHNVSKGVEST